MFRKPDEASVIDYSLDDTEYWTSVTREPGGPWLMEDEYGERVLRISDSNVAELLKSGEVQFSRFIKGIPVELSLTERGTDVKFRGRKKRYVLLQDFPASERLQCLRGWTTRLKDNRGEKLLDRLDLFLNEHGNGYSAMMYVNGKKNDCKSTLVKAFRERHPATEVKETGGVFVPVLTIDLRKERPNYGPPGERGLYEAILWQLFKPFSGKASLKSLQSDVFSLLKYCGVEMLVIDSIDLAIDQETSNAERFFHGTALLSEKIGIAVAMVGSSPPEAVLALIQNENRICLPEEIPSLKLNPVFTRHLRDIERSLPLKYTSTLHAPEMAAILLELSRGSLGGLLDLLREAARLAIEGGTERITVDLLRAVSVV